MLSSQFYQIFSKVSYTNKLCEMKFLFNFIHHPSPALPLPTPENTFPFFGGVGVGDMVQNKNRKNGTEKCFSRNITQH